MDVAPRDLASTVAALRDAHAAGNATIPHKTALLALCDRVSPLASAVGAVNTFYVDDGALVGDNTDVAGFDAAARALLERGGRALPTRVTLLGAGGAAAAVAAATSGWAGCELVLCARNAERASALARRFGHVRLDRDLPSALEGAELVVNATPVGMDGTELPTPVELVPPRAAAFDLVYRPGETAWVRALRDGGHPTCDGLTMLVEQAVLAFELWFGITPDRDVMWRAAHGR